jgi:transposase
MMGRLEAGQGQFFYSFDLDQVVPPDHLVRQIDGLLDLDWVHRELAPYYSHTGRPSIDPVLMIRMLLVGYVFAIRSERRICAEVQVNLAYRWFCKLGIEDKIPDHSVFCRARRERFRESDALRRVFRVGWGRSVLDRCEPDQSGRRQEDLPDFRAPSHFVPFLEPRGRRRLRREVPCSSVCKVDCATNPASTVASVCRSRRDRKHFNRFLIFC